MRALAAAALICLAAVARAEPALQDVLVKPGDTLWGIAQTYLKDPRRWDEILAFNTVPSRDPTVALPGMTLKIPIELIKEALRAARLVFLRGQVYRRPRGTADWKDGRLNMELYPQDAVRTLDNSEARVRFYAGQILTLTANSMVVLSPPKEESDLKLVEGEVKAARARIVTSSALILPASADVTYSARVKEDLTTLVRVFSGQAAVEAQGKRIELKAGFGAEVPVSKPPSDPIPLPELASLDPAAADGEGTGPRVVYRGGTLSVRTPTQQEVGPVTVGSPIQAFHVQISGDAGFDKVLFDKNFNAMETVDLNSLPGLPAGALWWRVALVDLLGFEGHFSPPRRLDRGKAPSLQH